MTHIGELLGQGLGPGIQGSSWDQSLLQQQRLQAQSFFEQQEAISIQGDSETDDLKRRIEALEQRLNARPGRRRKGLGYL